MAEKRSNTDFLREEEQSLWILAASPTIWAGHFLLSYITVAIWCAKVVGRDGMLGMARTVVIMYTVLALIGIGIVTWRSYRKHSFGEATAPHAFDTPGDRHRFLGFASLLLSGLSAVGVIYVALTLLFIDTCQ